MYKQLLEDSTAEKANTAVEQWRISAKGEFQDSYDKLEVMVSHMMTCAHVRDLVTASLYQSVVNQDNMVTQTLVNIATGVTLGFKYAMYLHEQRELASLDTK